MLQAKTKYGDLVTLALLTKTKIASLRKHTEFFCPTCDQPVMIKAGPQTIPHFAHYPRSPCPNKSSGEGPYHEKGKLMLYLWLKKQFKHVTLERYLSEINQQPDIYLTIGNKRIAIEYQCSRVDIRTIQARNRGYLSAGIIPIWILGANLFERKRTHQLKVDSFLWQFVHQFNNAFPLTVYFFCPYSSQFVSFTDIFMTQKNQAIGNIHFSKLKTITFSQLFQQKPLVRKTLYQLWKEEKRTFRLKHRYPTYGRTQAWYQWLYLQNTHIDFLPSFVYLPIRSQFLLKSPIWEWQSRLCLDILYKKPVGFNFTLQACTQRLKHDLHQNSYFPLITAPQHPIAEYLTLLKQLRIIEETAHNTYRIITPIALHRHLDDSLKNDSLVMEQLIQTQW